MAMHYLKAPQGLDPTDTSLKSPFVFMAGGITNCPDWQSVLIDVLLHKEKGLEGTLFNPRRKNFPIGDLSAAYEQIKWEFDALNAADIILFWFARGSDNPIVMYEYGTHLYRYVYEDSLPTIVVGCDPLYSRIKDVIMQTDLRSPNLTVHQNSDSFTAATVRAIRQQMDRLNGWSLKGPQEDRQLKLV